MRYANKSSVTSQTPGNFSDGARPSRAQQLDHAGGFRKTGRAWFLNIAVPGGRAHSEPKVYFRFQATRAIPSIIIPATLGSGIMTIRKP